MSTGNVKVNTPLAVPSSGVFVIGFKFLTSSSNKSVTEFAMAKTEVKAIKDLMYCQVGLNFHSCTQKQPLTKHKRCPDSVGPFARHSFKAAQTCAGSA